MDTIQIDYRSLPYKDLKAIRDQVDAVMAEQLEETKRTLRTQFLTVADEHGLSFKDIIGESDGRKHARIKYRNPNNPGETWSGRGKPPHWMQALLDQLRDKDEFLIKG